MTDENQLTEEQVFTFSHEADLQGHQIRFLRNDLYKQLILQWPDGSEWRCQAAYVFDTCHREALSASLTLKAAVDMLRTDLSNVSTRLLRFQNGNGHNVWTVGGTYMLKIDKIHISFYVKQDQTRSKRYLLAKLY